MHKASLGELLRLLDTEVDEQRGEFVVIIHGAEATAEYDREAARRLLGILLEELPLKKAAALAAKISGRKKNELYQLGLELVRREG